MQNGLQLLLACSVYVLQCVLASVAAVSAALPCASCPPLYAEAKKFEQGREMMGMTHPSAIPVARPLGAEVCCLHPCACNAFLTRAVAAGIAMPPPTHPQTRQPRNAQPAETVPSCGSAGRPAAAAQLTCSSAGCMGLHVPPLTAAGRLMRSADGAAAAGMLVVGPTQVDAWPLQRPSAAALWTVRPRPAGTRLSRPNGISSVAPVPPARQLSNGAAPRPPPLPSHRHSCSCSTTHSCQTDSSWTSSGRDSRSRVAS